MASQKIKVVQNVGDMTILTSSLATRKVYVTIVMKGEELWDMALSVTLEDAKAAHTQFLNMCQVFVPFTEGVEPGQTVNVQAAVDQLSSEYEMVVAAKRNGIH